MYYPHFGLKEPPFKITPNTDFFFSGGNRGAVLDALVYAITNGEGIIKVVGEVGSGKTMLCRMLQTILPEKIESIYLANPSVAPEEVLHAIAFELQLKLPQNADRLTVMQTLQAYLLERHAQGRQVVIFVEEAQGMPLATLEEIRLLSNLETKQDKLLQIVLFGQPELDKSLNQMHIRQLRERITHSFHLGPLQTKDISEYLIFRLRAAGYYGPHLFTDAAIKTLSKSAQGLVRRVNILADKALLAAFADNVHQVTIKHVNAAIQDSEFGEQGLWQSVKHYQKPIAWFGILALLGLIFFVLNRLQSPPQPALASKANTSQANVAAKQSAIIQSAVAVNHAASNVQALPRLTSVPLADIVVPVASPESSLIVQRLEATKKLLLNTSTEAISLQIQSLLSASLGSQTMQDAPLEAALAQLRQQVEIDNIYLYRLRQNDGIYTVILYGAYGTRAEALSALKSLPETIKHHQPYLRTLAGVKKEMLQGM